MKVPLRDNENEFNILDKNVDKETSPEAIVSMIEDLLYRGKNSGIAPDTKGADYFFIEGFINEDISWEFEVIAKELISL